MLSILPLVRDGSAAQSGPWRWPTMLHQSIAAAVAHERQTELIKVASRRRMLRAAKVAGRAGDRRGR